MCDFHSILGVAIGEDYSIRHNSGNSHSEMAGDLKNLPNRQCIIFEAEWDGKGEIPSDSNLIRNIGECPERLVKKIRDHYIKLKETITEGKHLGTYFADTEKYSDVWNKAIANGAAVVMPAVFKGNLHIYGSAKLDALTEVKGSLCIYGSAKLDAPALTEVKGSLCIYGSAKLDALTEVKGNLCIYGGAKLDAPALTEVKGSLCIYGELVAPKLKAKK